MSRPTSSELTETQKIHQPLVTQSIHVSEHELTLKLVLVQ